MVQAHYNPAGIHSADAAADALGITPLEVYRLVARGRLKATQTPAGPRITEEVLRAYVAAGAMDLIADARLSTDPTLGAVWLPEAPPLAVDMVRNECVGWLENNPISPSRAAALAANVTAAELTVDLPPAGELLGILQSPVRIERGFSRGADDPAFNSSGELFVVHHLRKATERAVKRQPSMTPPLQQLYATPVTYADLTAAGYQKLRELYCRFTHQFVVKGVPYGGPEMTPGEDGVNELSPDPSTVISGMEGMSKLFQVGRRRLAIARLAAGMPGPSPAASNGPASVEYRQRIVTIIHRVTFDAIAAAVGMSEQKLIERAF